MKEKEFTHLRDELSRRKRRELPWGESCKNYVFETGGAATLADRSMAEPARRLSLHACWGEKRDVRVVDVADSFDAARLHMAQRDTTLAVVSRATLPEIEAFKKRMGWQFP